MTKFAVISDLHIGKSAKGADLIPGGAPLPPKPFLRQFEEFCETTGQSAEFLLIPGDLTDSATPEECELAISVIERISKALSVKNNRVITIPGNHDADWRIQKSGEHDLYFQLRYQPLINAKGCNPALCSDPYFNTIEFDDVAILAINSSSEDRHDSSPHNGALATGSIAKFRSATSTWKGDRRIKICVLHHHPIQYPEVAEYWTDYSILSNSADLMKYLTDFEFDFVVHGHKHKPCFAVHTELGAVMLPILCAGSFSKTLPTPYDANVANQFHMLEVDGRDTATGNIYGKIVSWAYCGAAGWKPSMNESHGIHHFTPFGKYKNRNIITNTIESILKKEAASKPHIKVEEICDMFDFLKYQPTDILKSVIEDVCLRNSFEIHGSRLDKAVILLK